MHDQTQLLDEWWYRRLDVTQRSHYLSADHFGARKYWLGVPSVILSTVVGTSVFAIMERQRDIWLQIPAGLASVTVVLLASLQTFMGTRQLKSIEWLELGMVRLAENLGKCELQG